MTATLVIHDLRTHDQAHASLVRTLPAALAAHPDPLRQRGRGLRQGLLAQVLGVRPGALRFELASDGKPILARPYEALHFSTSYAGPYMALAWSQEGPLGVDLERIRPLPDLERVAQTYLPARVRAQWSLLPTDSACRAFWRAWTRFEATHKARGTPLARLPELPHMPESAGVQHSAPVAVCGDVPPDCAVAVHALALARVVSDACSS